MASMHQFTEIDGNTVLNINPSPLYTAAEYGTRNMNIISAATTFITVELYLEPKNSGIVFELSVWVIRLVRFAISSHESRQPSTALPMPIHILPIPMSQPCLPAYPTNITAEKYAVPYEKADTQPLTFLPPSKNPSRFFTFLKLVTPMPIIPSANSTNAMTVTV